MPEEQPSAPPPPTQPDHWHWCAIGLFGVVQMLARLSESDIRPRTETIASLRAARDQLMRIIDKASVK